MRGWTSKKATERGHRAPRGTFAERLTRLKGDESYHELARKMQQTGLNVTAQGLHKWMHGGGISAENLQDIARYFGVSPAYLYFGETSDSKKANDDSDLSREARLVAKAWSLLPERFAVPLAVDTFKVFEAFADKDDQRALHVEVKQALERLTKRS